jgi:hypothetical protein
MLKKFETMSLKSSEELQDMCSQRAVQENIDVPIEMLPEPDAEAKQAMLNLETESYQTYCFVMGHICTHSQV